MESVAERRVMMQAVDRSVQRLYHFGHGGTTRCSQEHAGNSWRKCPFTWPAGQSSARCQRHTGVLA